MPCVILRRLCVTCNKQTKPSCQEARFAQKSEIHLGGTKVCWCLFPPEPRAQQPCVAAKVPRGDAVSAGTPQRFYLCDCIQPEPYGQHLRSQCLCSLFFTAWAQCAWEPFARVKIMHDPIFPRLFTSWRVEIPGRERKEGKKKKKKKSSWIISAPQIAPRGEQML